MEFLKQILGDESYAQVVAKLDEYNAKPENKDKQVKLANIGAGEYVAKGKYDGLQAEKQTEVDKLKAANDLIDQLKKASKSDEDAQKKIEEYKAQVDKLAGQLKQAKLDKAIEVALLKEGVSDIDYLKYKLAESGDKVELDDGGNLKGWTDALATLKVKCPAQFKGEEEGTGAFQGFRPLDKNAEVQKPTISRESILKMPYAKQVEYFNENPEAYRELMNK